MRAVPHGHAARHHEHLWRLVAHAEAGPAKLALFAPDRGTVAVAGEGLTLRLWHVAAKQELAARQIDAPVSAVAFTPDGSLLAAGCADGAVRLTAKTNISVVSVSSGPERSTSPFCSEVRPLAVAMCLATPSAGAHARFDAAAGGDQPVGQALPRGAGVGRRPDVDCDVVHVLRVLGTIHADTSLGGMFAWPAGTSSITRPTTSSG